MTRKRLTSRRAAPLGAVQKGGNPRQEDESRRAEMRHPARQNSAVSVTSRGLKPPLAKKSRVWSRAITIMTRPRSVSIELRRVRAPSLPSLSQKTPRMGKRPAMRSAAMYRV